MFASALVFTLVGCGDTVVDGSTDANEAPLVCDSDFACPEGQICDGEPGCETPWTCQTAERTGCHYDQTIACGCSGFVFKTSSNCTWQPIDHEGFCGAEGTSWKPCTSTITGCCTSDTQCPTGGSCEQGYCVKATP